MRAEGASAAGANERAGRAGRHTPPAGAFAAALARARARPPEPGPAGPCPEGALAAAPLTRRRRGADAAQLQLGARREEAEPGRSAAAPRAEDARVFAAAERGTPEVAMRPPLLPTAALERLALEVSRPQGKPAVDMSFGRDVQVRLTRTVAGVAIVLRPADGLRGAAEAELPGLVAALRARGVVVASAAVEARPTAPGALTSTRGSATTAATSHPGGTVAKW